MKNVLVTGKNSYIGNSLKAWLEKDRDEYTVFTISMKDDNWHNDDFSKYDVVVHVAGIAHVSTNLKLESTYYKVNRDLTIEVANKAKESGVKQFIFMSSIIVYGDASMEKKIIKRDTIPMPTNFYGQSKLEAEKGIRKLEDNDFKVLIIRTPMVYGKGSKGNYIRLSKLARKIKIFPDMNNERSMIHIDNLCNFIKAVIDNECRGIFFPQNKEYVNTYQLVKKIGEFHDRNIYSIKFFNKIMRLFSPKIKIINKVFGNLVYDKSISSYDFSYIVNDFDKSVQNTERRKLLLVTEFFYPYKTSAPRILTELAEDFVEYGMEVAVLTSKNGYYEKNIKLKRKENYKDIEINRISSTNFDRVKTIGKLLNPLTFAINSFFYLIFKSNYDRLMFMSNPPCLPYIGYLLNKVKGKKYIYLVHDIYPDIAQQLNKLKPNGIIVKILNKINKKIFSNLSKAIVLGKDMQKILLEKGVDENRIAIVPNWADSKKIYEKKVVSDFYVANDLKDKFNIVYTGNISSVHKIDLILEVGESLKNHEDIQIIFIGEGSRAEYIKQNIKNNNMKNIKYFSYKFGEEYNDFLNCADIFISTLNNNLTGLGVPSKTYTYMAVGKPILALMDNDSEIGKMITENSMGKVFAEDDASKIAQYILKMKEDNKLYIDTCNNVKKAFSEGYDRKIVTRKFFEEINK